MLRRRRKQTAATVAVVRPMNNDIGPVADQRARDQALDVRRSFIVRAPAGSGKTRLLIQRYLALLAIVDEPEEITAITFTRKAAAEMRSRVLQAFASATDPAGDGSAVDDRVTRDHATRALARNVERGWQIAASPSRLRIQTIDSLNASITRQMPLTARFGAQPESIEDGTALYREAARIVLAQVNGSDRVADDVSILLAHLDNNHSVAESLLADMLRSRDHWLRNLPHMHERDALEAGLIRVRQEAVARAAMLFPAIERNETLALVRFAGHNRPADGVDAGAGSFGDMATFPPADEAALPDWLAVVDLLLTKEGSWRKRRGLNKNTGFPTSTNKQEKGNLDRWKTRMGDLLERLASAAADSDPLLAALGQLRGLPPAAYTSSQWAVLGAIVRLLPYATAQLWNVFGSRGQCDFTEISQAAARALGEDDAPTDLALALDYRIRHLLIDEFQDTSFAQFELLERLTRGWIEGDGRTLMVVGDPMQSIYRFREAEVGLFMKAWRDGIGGISLQPLSLQVNFRSQCGIVDWINATFTKIMPSANDAGEDEVPYAASVAHAASDGGGHVPAAGTTAPTVTWHPFLIRKLLPEAGNEAVDPGEETEMVSTGDDEAARIVEIIVARSQCEPNARIAILVRNRAHLHHIVPALKAAAIPFRAVDIDPLKERPVVLDLLALTRALLHLADRIAWLAVLRAPWCGLTLNDLATLTGAVVPRAGELLPDARTVWQILGDAARVSELSADGQVRVGRLCAVLSRALNLRRRMPLRDLVETTWLALLGPACLSSRAALSDAAQLLDLLEREAQVQAGGNDIVDLAEFESRVDKLFAGSPASGEGESRAAVQIMTIHKAKGLEFDTVIVPGLHRSPRLDDRKLLVWTEQLTNAPGGSELLLAPIRETGASEELDAIYRYVQQLERYRQQQEDVRLLYVAATRAESRLHLLATVTVVEKGDEGPGDTMLRPPRATSLLAPLWPVAFDAFVAELNSRHATAPDGHVIDVSNRAVDAAGRQTGAMRVIAGQPLPAIPAAISGDLTNVADKAESPGGSIEFDWAGETARHVGTVVHQYLQYIAEDGIEHWTTGRIAASRARIERELSCLGVDGEGGERSVAAGRVLEALRLTLTDARGRWILQAREQARSEWCLTGLVGDIKTSVAIDRWLVDEAGVQWIIDFKTGGHEGGDIDAFLDNEQRRYREQLETYAAVLQARQLAAPKPVIKLGLYFPLSAGWREWTWRTG